MTPAAGVAALRRGRRDVVGLGVRSRLRRPRARACRSSALSLRRPVRAVFATAGVAAAALRGAPASSTGDSAAAAAVAGDGGSSAASPPVSPRSPPSIGLRLSKRRRSARHAASRERRPDARRRADTATRVRLSRRRRRARCGPEVGPATASRARDGDARDGGVSEIGADVRAGARREAPERLQPQSLRRFALARSAAPSASARAKTTRASPALAATPAAVSKPPSASPNIGCWESTRPTSGASRECALFVAVLSFVDFERTPLANANANGDERRLAMDRVSRRLAFSSAESPRRRSASAFAANRARSAARAARAARTRSSPLRARARARARALRAHRRGSRQLLLQRLSSFLRLARLLRGAAVRLSRRPLPPFAPRARRARAPPLLLPPADGFARRSLERRPTRRLASAARAIFFLGVFGPFRVSAKVSRAATPFLFLFLFFSFLSRSRRTRSVRRRVFP